MNSQAVKTIRKQIRNVVQALLPEVLKQEMFSTIKEEVEKELRTTFGARLEAINDSIMDQLKTMDERSKDLQQFMLNQVQSELAKQAPQVVVDQKLPDSANLDVATETQPQT